MGFISMKVFTAVSLLLEFDNMDIFPTTNRSTKMLQWTSYLFSRPVLLSLILCETNKEVGESGSSASPNPKDHWQIKRLPAAWRAAWMLKAALRFPFHSPNYVLDPANPGRPGRRWMPLLSRIMNCPGRSKSANAAIGEGKNGPST